MMLRIRPSRNGLRILAAIAVAMFVLAALFALLAARVSALRALRATGPNWSFPSRVYSDDVLLTAGRTAPLPYLVHELDARGYTALRSAAAAPGSYAVTPDGLDLALRGIQDETDPEGGGGPEHVLVRLVNGRIAAVERLGGFAGARPPDTAHPPRIEPALISLLFDEERMWRTWVSLDRVPAAVRKAIVVSEDRRFFGHAGIDVRGMLRALSVDLRAKGVRQGGSTITQQLARGLFLGRERTLTRKLVEVPIAMALEVLLSKDQILEMYLNSVYWGQARGFTVGGIAEASRWYFDAPVESLGTLEGATLAAMIPGPNLLDPFEHPDRLIERRNGVLHDLVETHDLSESEAQEWSARPLDVRHGPLPVERFPSYSGYVRSVLDKALTRHAATHQGLAVFTTMDLGWQVASERTMDEGLAALDGGGRRDAPLEGAFVALEPATSAVVAMVGGRSMETGDFNRAHQARRQSGSAIKPIVYAAAFMSSQGLTPASTVPDLPRAFGEGKWAWRPRNYDGGSHDEVTLALALERSLNIATANVVERIGPHAVADMAARFGLGKLKPVMSIGLGSNEVTLVDLTNAFAVFAAHGMRRAPSPIRVVTNRAGRHVLSPRPEAEMAVPSAIAALMTAMLQNVVRYGVAHPLESIYRIGRPVAGKTGTTDDFHDAWFIGFTPDVVAGTWIGYDQPRSIGRPAALTALPVWARTVGRLLEGFPPANFTADTELEWTNIDPLHGCRVAAESTGERVPFILGSAPTSTCGDTLGPYTPVDGLDSLDRADTTWVEPAEPSHNTPEDTLDEAPADTTADVAPD